MIINLKENITPESYKKVGTGNSLKYLCEIIMTNDEFEKVKLHHYVHIEDIDEEG